MWQMAIEQMIEVLQAFKDGKMIECRVGTGEWRYVPSPGFDFESCVYRVRPEPREWWIVFDKGTYMDNPSIYAVEQKLTHCCGREQVHVREVLEP